MPGNDDNLFDPKRPSAQPVGGDAPVIDDDAAIPVFKGKPSDALLPVEREVSDKARDDADAAPPVSGDDPIRAQHASHGSHGSHGSW